MEKNQMSDEAVKKATGKAWREWFAILDKAGAKKMTHRDIAQWVYDHYLGQKGKGTTNVATSAGWWSQMVTVTYERARGLRAVNQNATGFLVAMHRSVAMPVGELIKAWAKLERSKSVAPKKLERIPSKTQRRMLRYKAKEGGLVVSFDERPGTKSRIMIEAIRLPNKSAVERARAFWKSILALL